MTPLFKKLNFKDHKTIIALNYPSTFDKEILAMKDDASFIIHLKEIKEIEFGIFFVSSQKEIDFYLNKIISKLKGDAILWFCYPKASSKKYKCEFNRDNGWSSFGALNLEPVRQVAIDEDWSALRFRKVEFIKTITRRESFALTTEAKQRTTQKGK